LATSGFPASPPVSLPTGLDHYPLLEPGERLPISDLAYPPRLGPRPMENAVFFQALLARITWIEQPAYGRLVEFSALQLALVRSVGKDARSAIWTSMRERAPGVPLLLGRVCKRRTFRACDPILMG